MASNDHRSSYQNYPHLTKREFTEACHLLDRRYRQATLGPLRRQWRLNVHTALELNFQAGSGSTTFLQITRPLDNATAADDELAASMGSISLRNPPRGRYNMRDRGNATMVEMEDADMEVYRRPSRATYDVPHVKYEIHLHPTYRVPCLWFSLHHLPEGESALNFETVIQRLVPEQYRESIRNTGPIGGISLDVSEYPVLRPNCDVYSITQSPEFLRSSSILAPSERPWLDFNVPRTIILWYG